MKFVPGVLRLACTFAAVIALLSSGSSSAQAASPPLEMAPAPVQAASDVCNTPSGCVVSGFQRTEIVPGIVHYSAIVQVGPGAHDMIGIHRVVKENRQGCPMNVPYRVFLVHGDWKNFVGCFLPSLYSPTTSAAFNFAVYLARNNVDVWGIDQAWTLVPAETTDFAFMATWGMQRQIDDARMALAIARRTRALMGAGEDRFNLLGYSSGAMTGYALLDYEAQLPRAQRHIQGFISADMPYKSPAPDWVDISCWYEDYTRSLYDQGLYQEEVIFRPMGYLARTDPDGSSPFFPGFTNLQAALFLGVAPLFGATPVHYVAGVFDDAGMPTGPQYFSTEAWLDFLESGVAYEPWLFELNYWEILCGLTDNPFDDHLAQVTVPVYNWGTRGGLGWYGLDTLPLLGSKDTSSLIISLHPPEEILLDFAHIDLFLGRDAPELAWGPLVDWLKAHP